MGTKEPKAPGGGKGGDFTSSPNPFANKRKVGVLPACAEQAFLGQAIDRVLASGRAVIFGTTRDGGAVCITVLDGDERHKSYSSNPEELGDALDAMQEYFGQ